MSIPREETVIIKMEKNIYSNNKAGDLGISSLRVDTIMKSDSWRIAKDLEIDLYWMGIKNVREAILKFD